MRIVWFAFILLFLVTGCHIQESTPQTISDTVTPYYVSEMKDVPEDTILIENLIDEMDQGTFEYHSGEWGKFVVNPNQREFNRGDVVYIETPKEALKNQPPYIPETKILRIVVMPGERLKVKKGQIFINDLRLDAFYGSARNHGMTEEQYIVWANENEEDPHRFNDYFHQNVEEITIPQEHYFVIGDNWWRSVDSFKFGPIHKKDIIGTVIGYKK
ncbi:signal peptidase I [Paenibacillus sp. FSL W7-1332]|uniref:signal peptidase I n=1 Tax=Paenibacillus sp. FSL W7-1332 TaxID=2921702 RepID=UPI0030D1A4F9